MRGKLRHIVVTIKRLPLPMQLIMITAILATVLAAIALEAYQRHAAAQRDEKQALWPHMQAGAPPNAQKLRRLSGLWLYETKTRRARLQMTEKGTFQLITRHKDLITRRNYVRGFYSVRNQTLYLRRDGRFGRPYVQGRPEIQFRPITIDEISVPYDLRRQGQRMIWTFTTDTRNIQNLQHNLAGGQVETVQWYKAR